MHRLAAMPGGWTPGQDGVIFVEQSPAPIIILTAADTDIQSLAIAQSRLPQDFPAVRVVNLLQLQQQLTIDTYAEAVLSSAQAIVLRLLGGQSYWPYGLEVVKETVQQTQARLFILPGDTQPDPTLVSHSTAALTDVDRLWHYFVEGGIDNMVSALQFLSDTCLESHYQPPQPMAVPRVGLYKSQSDFVPSLPDKIDPPLAHPKRGIDLPKSKIQNPKSKMARVGLLFYRSHYLSGNLAPIDALCEALCERCLIPVPLFVSSLREADVQAEMLAAFCADDGPTISVLLNTTSFAAAKLDGDAPDVALWRSLNVPVLQVILSGGTQAQWQANWQGLSPRDIAMNVALPEVDGRIISRAISFKSVQTRNTALETDVVTYEPVGDRVQFVADLAQKWVTLAHTPVPDRRIALVLANYPNRDGRIANGVGLDTPESCVRLLTALQTAGYTVENIPKNGDDLIQRLTQGVTNDPEARELRPVAQSLAWTTYQTYFDGLPETVKQAVGDRWSFYTSPQPSPLSPQPSPLTSPQPSPYQGEGAIPISGIQLGNIFVGIQPSRGYDRDPSLNYHAPDLEPTHDYLAFYYWLRHQFDANAMVHVGKHGNLEWLPGKGIALTHTCYPEIALGPLPHFYPFIVNDPGEGAQAKRRSQAVIIDHLTPPMTRAELYGPLLQLESLIDEYYDAQSMDPSRVGILRDRIVQLMEQEQLQLDLTSPQPSPYQGEGDGLVLPLGKGELEGVMSTSPQPSPYQGEGDRLVLPLSKGELEGVMSTSPQPSPYQGEGDRLVLPLGKGELEGVMSTSPQPSDSQALIARADGYLCELKEAQIRDGLHILGHCPTGRQLRDLVIAIARHPHRPSVGFSKSVGLGKSVGFSKSVGLTRAIATAWTLDFDPLTTDPTTPLDRLRLNPNTIQPEHYAKRLFGCRNHGEAIALIEEYAAEAIDGLMGGEPECSQTPDALRSANVSYQRDPSALSRYPSCIQSELIQIQTDLLPKLYATSQELTHLLHGLNGGYVPSGASGAPTRGRTEVLPTGRNFYSVDIRAIPTPSAWDVGRRAAETLIERYTQEHGDYPKTLGLSIWGTSTMRTGGDDIAEALALLGVQPVWDGPSRRVVDFEILPVSVLGRPRVDVTLRVSGFFRDAFANLIDLFHRAVEAVAALKETADDNPLAAQVIQDSQRWQRQGLTKAQAEVRSHYRVFGSKPGAYGAGLQGLIEAQNWADEDDLARAYINWSSYAYTGQGNGQSAPEAFDQRLQTMEIVLHNQDNREHDLLDSDDYYQFQGGLTAAVRSRRGTTPTTYFGDHSIPEKPRVRHLKEEIARVYRSRVVNPKWVQGVMRHGYKGAFEMAATVDYLFAYDATTHCAEDHMYAGVATTYLLDTDVQKFVKQSNPWALRDMAERLLEAHQRGLWQQADRSLLDQLRALVHEAEAIVEAHTDPMR